jgi:hypothetical protein
VTLRDALEAAAAAADLPGVTASGKGTRTEWLAGGVVFAALEGDLAEFRLDPVVARAARGTPDTAVSSRGPDWVAFRPQELDRMALDRLTAWYTSAARRAVAIRH